MASETTASPKMIVQYEWILDNVEEEPMTIASKMILFRGERVFRVGLKNLVTSPVLFFMAIDLNKIGMRVKEVMWGACRVYDNISPAEMWRMREQEIGGEGSLQLFKTTLVKQVIGDCTFLFRIQMEGNIPSYSYQLSDRLAKNQLWDSTTVNSQLSAVDVELNVRERTFSAHQAILAARSPVFATEFAKKQPLTNGPLEIQIDGVEPSTLEQFLYFIYTGESVSSLANEELLKLAVKYQLTTLAGLCRIALNKIETTQMLNLTSSLHDNPEKSYPSTIRPDKDTELFFDRTMSTFQCELSFTGSENGKSKCMMQFQNENIFSAYFTGEVRWMEQWTTDKATISKPVFHFSCSKHRKFGLKIEDVYCENTNMWNSWFKMESKHLQKNAELLQYFTAQSEFDVKFNILNTVSFDIKIASTICNYYYDMMDDAWMKDFWTAATNKKLTDVEIFVGTVKLMEAHRVILSARSPVMNAALNKISDTGKAFFTFGAEFDVDNVKFFLYFVYTGSLKTFATSESPNYKQLLKLATKYEMETLKNLCQLANHVPDVEELTNCLLLL